MHHTVALTHFSLDVSANTRLLSAHIHYVCLLLGIVCVMLFFPYVQR